MSAEIPVNLFTVQKPFVGEVVENKRLTPAPRGLDNDVRHIVIRYKEKFPYVPGQSVGILIPGVDPQTGKPHKPRLYSVASERVGDLRDSQTVSLCVVRHFWDNPKADEKHVPGLASNYLCDLKKSDRVTMTGPVGRHFVIPDDFMEMDFIFVATGTGIAPYRGMLKEMFDAGFSKHVSLYFGVQYRDVVLYDDEFCSHQNHKNFTYIRAISREEKNSIPDIVPTRENRMYVQVKMYENRDSLASVLSKRNSMIYLCGLKGMEAGIFPTLEKIGSDLRVQSPFVQKLKGEKRLRVEVY